MNNFKTSYKRLNTRQKEAVDIIDGPVLVIAGPGTGKTQLLSARTANIIDKTDTLAQNILCLTFTDSGALNMRERLSSMIGPQAYDVTISTYHSFGSDIIKSYPEFFEEIGTERSEDIRMERPIDELTQIQIVTKIVNPLPFNSPMLSSRYHIKSVVNTISELKQALLSPAKLRSIAKDNLRQINVAQSVINKAVNDQGGFSRKKVDNFRQYGELLKGIHGLKGDLLELAHSELTIAKEEADNINSTKPLTAWKNKWLAKDDNDNFTFTKRSSSERMSALADVFEEYQTHMQKLGLYDFDDMIIRTIDAIKNDDELRYNLQEKYQYILLDEFQDTNPAQFELVRLIADHPVHEGRPNVFAVGDDDQAIFAFQGASVGNMKKFLDSFRDVKVINLTENYRSHHEIIHVAHNISEQIEDRLHHNLKNIDKTLHASGDNLPDDAIIQRHEFNSQAGEYGWIGEEISKLVMSGVKPQEIAVLSPKHKLLESLVPFINNQGIPISYIKRENILETPIVESFKLMAELVLALQRNVQGQINQLFPVVLSMPFWNIPVEEIWKTNWQFHSYDEKRSWPEIALDNKILTQPVKFYLSLGSQSVSAPLETILDALTGTIEVTLGDDESFVSPLKEYYFSEEEQTSSPLEYFETLSHLSVIRSKLRDHQAGKETKLTLDGFLDFFEMYEAAEQPLVNSHPIAQNTDAVQLMTVYKAKGLEFEHVFILSAHDDVWGSRAKSGSNKISLPENLKHIRYSGSSEDELRRLLFVAITRAKVGLYITSHALKDSGKKNEAVKYLNEADGISSVLPEGKQEVKLIETDKQMLSEHIETLWKSRHTKLDTTIKHLLSDRLAKYQMSPTHLNSFIDLEYGGPESFLLNTLLRFPQAPTTDSEYGTAIHETLQWYQNRINNDKQPTLEETLEHYESILKYRYISMDDMDNTLLRGREALKLYLQSRHEMFEKVAKAEVNFYSEGVLVDNAHLSGKIDRLEINDKDKTLQIVDYKTGSSFKSWRVGSELKHLKYEQQLYLYKILIENSNTYKSYRVESARLDFIEPERASGKIAAPLYIEFDDKKETEIKRLVNAVWDRIQALDLPDTSSYQRNITGSKKFIKDLIN